MKKFNLVFVGMDTHKSFIECAYVEDGYQGGSGQHGRIKPTKKALSKMIRQFESKYPGVTFHFIYEAGPCGYWIYRYITSLGHLCFVIAPSLIPKKPGDRVKTDRRDAMKLAQSFKSGSLTPIYVPEEEDEAIRDLSRMRESAMWDLNKIRHQIKAFLLRNHITTKEKEDWNEAYLRWLSDLKLPHPSQQFVLTEMLQIFNERHRRHERVTNELTHKVMNWRYYPVVKAIQAMRGVQLLVAAGVICELGDLTRFDHPRKLMSYVGMTPSEHSSGDNRKRGSITRCGNSRARRLLVEGAHSYRFPANVSRYLLVRQEGLPQRIKDIAWEAQQRLCRRYQALLQRGKPANVIKVAIAREMIAYIWSIAKEVVLTPVDASKNLARVPHK